MEIGYPRLGDLKSISEDFRDTGQDGRNVLVSQLALVGVIDLDLMLFHIRTVMSASAAIS